MAYSLRLILSAIIFLSLIQSGQAKTSTENLIVKESDILEFKKSTEIEEGDFFEDVQINSEEYVWVVNLKNGPFSTKEKANQAALELKKTLGITLPKLPKEISILRKSKSPNNKNFNRAKFSWMINLSLGVYDSKDKALQIAQELKAIQKVPENVFLTRETKDIKTSKFAENIIPEVSGQIFLSREATQIKDKTKHFILVATKSNSLNVRKNPSSSSPVIARLLRGSKVPHIQNNNPENRSGSWFYIEYSKGKFGWVSSSYTKKIIGSGSRISQQASLKTVKPKQVQTSEAPRTSEFRELKSLVALLQTELNKIKADKAKVIEANNQANTKANEEKLASIKEFNASKEKNARETKDLQTITAYLRSELNKIKSDKTNAIEARNRSRAKLEISVTESNKKIKDLQTTTTSLRSELDMIKTDKANAIEATNQANTKANEEKLASAKEFQSLKEKSSKQIKDLQTTTTSLRSELDMIKTDKAKVIEANNQANTKANEEKLASAKEFQSLKEKSSKQIKDLQTTTTSLRSELDMIKTDKANAIEATNQANTKANEEKLASAKEFQSLKEKSSKQIKDLQTTTASLRSELDKITTDKAKAIEATNQANTKAKEERLASSNEKNMLKEKINTLSVFLEKFKIDKEKATQSTNQANAKANEERLASAKEFKSLKEKSSKQIKDLQTTTVSLRSELDMIKTDKANAIEATNQANAKANEEKLASAKLVASLKVNNEKEISNLREKNSNKIKNLKEKTLKEIVVLKFTTASLQKELETIKGDKEDAINTIDQTNAKIQATNLNNLNFTKKLKDTVLFLRKELDKLKEEKTGSIRAVNQTNDKLKVENRANSTEINNINEASREKILDLKTTVAYLPSELNKAKDDRTNKLTAINQASIKSNKRFKESSAGEIKTLNSTIKNLRTVLERFKVERLKSAEVKKSRETKIETEQTIREKEFNALKKESTALKLQLDKANLDRVKAMEGVNFNNIETQADQIAQDNEFKEFRQKSAREIAELKDEATSLTLPSSAKKLRGLTSPGSTKQKNKITGILDKPAKKKIISKKEFLPSSTDIDPESIINAKLLHWVKAWESRNVPLYLSFYSKSFWDPKRSRSLWKSHRRKSLEKKINISVQISNIKMYALSKNIIGVNFLQRFKSNKFSDIGLKELVWKKDTDGWKITKETWKPR